MQFLPYLSCEKYTLVWPYVYGFDRALLWWIKKIRHSFNQLSNENNKQGVRQKLVMVNRIEQHLKSSYDVFIQIYLGSLMWVTLFRSIGHKILGLIVILFEEIHIQSGLYNTMPLTSGSWTLGRISFLIIVHVSWTQIHFWNKE